VGADRPPGVLLDGVPRTIHQAEALDALMSAGQIDAVVHIEVPESVALARLVERGGDDDLGAAMHRRLDAYRRLTLPMVAWMTGRRPVLGVDGTRPVDLVTAEIVWQLEALDPIGSGCA
jgi:adenylate kinase